MSGLVTGTPSWLSQGVLEYLHTPGHAPGHLAFIHTPTQSVIAGDAFSHQSWGWPFFKTSMPRLNRPYPIATVNSTAVQVKHCCDRPQGPQCAPRIQRCSLLLACHKMLEAWPRPALCHCGSFLAASKRLHDGPFLLRFICYYTTSQRWATPKSFFPLVALLEARREPSKTFFGVAHVRPFL